MTPFQKEDLDRQLELEERWHPLNRIQREDPFFRFVYWGCWTVGVLAAVCAVAELFYQVGLVVAR